MSYENWIGSWCVCSVCCVCVCLISLSSFALILARSSQLNLHFVQFNVRWMLNEMWNVTKARGERTAKKMRTIYNDFVFVYLSFFRVWEKRSGRSKHIWNFITLKWVCKYSVLSQNYGARLCLVVAVRFQFIFDRYCHSDCRIEDCHTKTDTTMVTICYLHCTVCTLYTIHTQNI